MKETIAFWSRRSTFLPYSWHILDDFLIRILPLVFIYLNTMLFTKPYITNMKQSNMITYVQVAQENDFRTNQAPKNAWTPKEL